HAEEAGANVTETRYAAGTGSGSAQRTAGAVATAINASGQGLNNEFPGSTLNTDGSISGLHGTSSSQQYTLLAGQVVTVSADLTGTATGQFYALAIGTPTNCYEIRSDGNGSVYIAKIVAGVLTGITAIINTGAETTTQIEGVGPHSLRLTITVGATNIIEASFDTLNFSGSDSSLTLTTGTWPVTVWAGSLTGKMNHYHAAATQQHQGMMPGRVQTLVLPPATAIPVDGSPFNNGLIFGRHMSGAATTDTGALFTGSGEMLFTRHDPSVQGTLQTTVNGPSYLQNGSVALDTHVADGTTYQRVKATELTTGFVHQLNDGTNVRTAGAVAASLDSSGRVIGNIYDGTTALSPANLTNAITTGGLVKVANATGEILYANTSSEYQTNFNSAGLAQNTTMFNNLGICINNTAGNPGYSYTSTTTSISISIPASTYTNSDGSTVSVPSYAHNFGGLAALTGYYFDMWHDAPSNTFGAAIYAGGAPSAATVLADCYHEGRTPVNGKVYIITPSSGTGSGSGAAGSGGCPAAYQVIETQERGLIRADEIEVGMHLPLEDRWVRVNKRAKRLAPLWRYTIKSASAEVRSFDVNDTHAVFTSEREWVYAKDLKPGDSLYGGAAVVDSSYLAEGLCIEMEVEGHVYTFGDATCHNISL
ncbi:MAG: Hint domain-containing protein, partial [Acidiferrobacteraceae bacterium]